MNKIYAVGETVFDIIFKEYQPQAARPGGSAFNAIISLGRLGLPCSFISEVGNDRIGRHILDFLQQNGVDNRYVVRFEQGKSALSLAFLNHRQDAEYDFYKDYPNQRLHETFPDFTAEDYLLFGSFYGLNPALRPRMKEILDRAHGEHTLIYYDPNFRASHLDDRDELLPVIEENMRYAGVVRASDEDMHNIYGVDTANDAWEKVRPCCNVFIYTANAHGVYLRTPHISLHMEVEQIKPVSTIGAGDTFNAGVLYGLFRRGVTLGTVDRMDAGEWIALLEDAARFSREVCMGYDNYISREFAGSYRL